MGCHIRSQSRINGVLQSASYLSKVTKRVDGDREREDREGQFRWADKANVDEEHKHIWQIRNGISVILSGWDLGEVHGEQKGDENNRHIEEQGELFAVDNSWESGMIMILKIFQIINHTCKH